MRLLSSILIVICFTFILFISGCGKKEEEVKTDQKESKNKTETQSQNNTQSQSNTLSQSNTSTSETAKLWNQIEKINESMGKGINSGKSGHLEEPVAEIISMIKKIPAAAGNLEPASLQTIISKTNELRKSGEMLDKYHHANQTSELKEEYSKFTLTLNEIKNVLPK
ncbi:MAG TPA: hypothetical protein PK536_02250 [Ignavibacteria bacterium]|nr:hypothetical protein [Bacteroidota bacterium]HRI84249.1 hypothetical protein [Ignavibacteria bacterium]HRJ99063.1 hypothetical protein [Ignavibacteria bacterium]